MNDVREIVTRAVLAKGRKKFKFKETVLVNSDVSSVLGCWIINHEFSTELKNKEVVLNGSFENNLWYNGCILEHFMRRGRILWQTNPTTPP